MTAIHLAEAPSVSGLRFRRFQDDADYAAIAALITACNVADGIDYVPTADTLRAEYEPRTDIDPRRDFVLAEVDGRLVGYGEANRQVRDGLAVYWTFGVVLPEFRRRGVGRAILHANEARGRGIAAGHDDAGGRAFGSWVNEREGGAVELLESEGYAPVRFGFTMVRPTLDDLPDAAVPDGLELRPVEPAHHRAIFEADNEAFRDHWGHREATDDDFASTFESPDIDTTLWRVAWEGDEVAGSVTTWVWKAENETLGVQRGWLEHISVRRPWRKRGLASALIVSALAGLRDAGMTEAMLGVDADNLTGALRLYEKLGFRVKDRSTNYRKAF
jgi:mycothiol synthase